MRKNQKNWRLEGSRILFNLPFDQMLKRMDEDEALDERIFMNSEMCSETWFSALKRREGRCSLMMFRIEFELGLCAKLKDGTTASNAEVAKDLFELGWINRDRYEIALKNLDLVAAMV